MRAVSRCSRSRIFSPHIGHSLTAIDFSPTDPYRTRSLMQGHTSRFGGEPVAVMTREDLRQDANWFADEVSIDFPSMAIAVERIRRAFLADEGPQTLRADVELTDREAAAGVTLPLEVPVHCTCRECGGRGETWTETCLRCRGRGSELLRHPVHVTVPAGVRNGARFCFTVTPRHNRSTRIELRVVIAADH
jgi:hypothetical protein